MGDGVTLGRLGIDAVDGHLGHSQATFPQQELHLRLDGEAVRMPGGDI
jgi:hypothetical protein